MLNYTSVDKDPYHGISYYRLKQTDYDGTNAYSQTVIINYTSAAVGQVMIYPNPITQYALISLNASIKHAGNIDFELYDVVGKKIMGTKLAQLNAISDNVYRFEKGSLTPGTYFFRLVNDGEKLSEGKLIVQ
jgi:hypothetical protein